MGCKACLAWIDSRKIVRLFFKHRGNYMNKQYASIFAVTLFGFCLINTAQATQNPNVYNCTGKNVNLNLVVGSKAEVSILPAKTRLELQMGQKKYSFQEQEIMSESTLIGDLWEVTLKYMPDIYIDHATLVIPSINLGESPLRFKSQLILTRVSTPFIGKPLEGIVNASKYIALTCKASVIYF